MPWVPDAGGTVPTGDAAVGCMIGRTGGGGGGGACPTGRRGGGWSGGGGGGGCGGRGRGVAGGRGGGVYSGGVYGGNEAKKNEKEWVDEKPRHKSERKRCGGEIGHFG